MRRNPIYWLAHRFTKGLSKIFYNAGIDEYWAGHFRESAQLLFNAFMLDGSNQKAGKY